MAQKIKIEDLLRPNILRLKPYSSARDEYTGSGGILLDANENPHGSAVDGRYNRYPDPRQRKIKAKLAELKGIEPENIFIGNGSDEAIDLLFRAFCNPGKDQVILLPPTYGMYKVCAGINDVETMEIRLTDDFQPDVPAILRKGSEKTKLLFICSPNNPTANTMNSVKVLNLASKFTGIVVVDEAYIDFSEAPSFVNYIKTYSNLVVLQTMSKAWGMAGLRMGMAYASSQVIDVLNKIKPPYNVNMVTQQIGIEALDNIERKEEMVSIILDEKRKLSESLKGFDLIKKIYPSDTNYLLVKVEDPDSLYQFFISEKIIVRNRSNVILCEGCLRITIGTKKENQALLTAIIKYEKRIPQG